MPDPGLTVAVTGPTGTFGFGLVPLLQAADRRVYGQEKAEPERLLLGRAQDNPDIGLYLLRPPIVLGPHGVGAKDVLPGPVAAAAQRMLRLAQQIRVPVPVPAPDLPIQFIHEDDVGQALLECVVAEGPPGAYNI